MSFEQFKQKYCFTNKDLITYHDLPSVEQLCYADQPLFKTISRVYEALMSSLFIPDLDRPRLRWEKDLGINLDGELWGDMCSYGVTSYLNSTI